MFLKRSSTVRCSDVHLKRRNSSCASGWLVMWNSIRGWLVGCRAFLWRDELHSPLTLANTCTGMLMHAVPMLSYPSTHPTMTNVYLSLKNKTTKWLLEDSWCEVKNSILRSIEHFPIIYIAIDLMYKVTYNQTHIVLLIGLDLAKDRQLLASDSRCSIDILPLVHPTLTCISSTTHKRYLNTKTYSLFTWKLFGIFLLTKIISFWSCGSCSHGKQEWKQRWWSYKYSFELS